MAKHLIEIQRFGGVKGTLDSLDLDINQSAYNQDLDPIQRQGRAAGRRGDQQRSSSVTGIIFIPFYDGTEAVYYDTAAAVVKVLRGLPSVSSITNLGAATSSGVVNGSSDGQAVHLAMGGTETSVPKWVGRINGTLQMENAVLAPPETGSPDVVLAQTSGHTLVTTGYFKADFRYFWAVSWVYDGYQESPLVRILDHSHHYDDAEEVANEYDKYALILNRGTGYGDRVTHINVYRAEQPDGGSSEPFSAFVLIKQIAMDDADWSGDVYDLDDTGTQGPDFETLAGIPETLEHMDVHYGLSTVIGPYHVIGDAWLDDFENPEHFLFRSLAGRYDAFKWSTDYLQLPSKPIGLVTFTRRIFAFGTGRTYVVNEALSLDDTLEGIGLLSPTAVVVADPGMFWADKNNIYFDRGAGLKAIGTDVLLNDYDNNTGWLSRTSSIAVALYSAKMSCFIMAFTGGGSTGNIAWAYYWPLGEWYLMDLPNGTLQGGFMSATGEPMIVIDGTMYELFGQSSRKNWIWVSSEVHNGGDPQCVYQLEMIEPTLDVAFREDGGAWVQTPTAPEYRTVNGNATPPWKRTKRWQCRIIGIGGEEVKQVGIRRRTFGTHHSD